MPAFGRSLALFNILSFSKMKNSIKVLQVTLILSGALAVGVATPGVGNAKELQKQFKLTDLQGAYDAIPNFEVAPGTVVDTGLLSLDLNNNRPSIIDLYDDGSASIEIGRAHV